MNTQTIGVLTAENQTFYDTALLRRCLPLLSFYEDALKKRIPEGKGTTIEFRKFGSLAAATTPLTEGTTPAGKDLAITSITKALSQYGDFVIISDVLDTQSKDPVIAETSELLGEQAAKTVNKIIADEIAAGTNVRYAGNASARTGLASTDVLTGALVKKVVRDLKKNNISTFADGKYHATISADQAYDLQSDTASGGWIDVVKYANVKKLLDGEIGEYNGVRFRVSSETPVVEGAPLTYAASTDTEVVAGKKYYTVSSNVYTAVATPTGNPSTSSYYEVATTVSVHQGLFYGKDAYGVPEIGATAAKPKIIVKSKGSAGTSDPLEQRSSIGWKNMFAAKRLNELAIVRVETGVTA